MAKLKSIKKGPIRKVKAAIAAGGITTLLLPIVKPIIEGWLGVEVERGFIEQIVVLTLDSSAVIAAIVGAYAARPGIDDVTVIES